MKLIDLSITIENEVPSDPQEMIPVINYLDHEKSVPDMLRFFETAKKEDLPNGLAWAMESVQLTTHTGTHMDAPYHYHPTMDDGQPAWTIEEVPLDWCYGNGVMLDFSDKPNGYQLTIPDFQHALKHINYTLKEKDIVLIQTGAAPFWGDAKLFDQWMWCRTRSNPLAIRTRNLFSWYGCLVVGSTITVYCGRI